MQGQNHEDSRNFASAFMILPDDDDANWTFIESES